MIVAVMSPRDPTASCLSVGGHFLQKGPLESPRHYEATPQDSANALWEMRHSGGSDHVSMHTLWLAVGKGEPCLCATP